MHLMAW